MMRECHDIESRLDALIDGELETAEQARVHAHLDTCAACRGLADDLTRVRDAARGLGPLRPPDHVWLEVAGQMRLGEPRPPTAPAAARSRPALVQWVGLAAALVIITLGAYLFTRLSPADPVRPPSNAARTPSVESVAEELRLATQHYEKAINELEQLAKAGDTSLDPDLAGALQRSIAVLDQAAAESRKVLSDDPANLPARESLFEALRRKVGVLQSTVLLMNEMRQGDAAGAARAAEALRKSS